MSIFDTQILPPTRQYPFVDGADDRLSIEALQFLQQMWQWIVSGRVIIPCTAGGTANAITLEPIFQPGVGASGYDHLLPFSFVAESTNTAAATIQLVAQSSSPLTGAISGSTTSDGLVLLDAVPAYIGAVAAASGDIVAGVPYLAFYCDATDSLPARMVLK